MGNLSTIEMNESADLKLTFLKSEAVKYWHYHYYECIHIYIGEGNSNPLQCSCLENSMDGGTWQATVHGVAESQT